MFTVETQQAINSVSQDVAWDLHDLKVDAKKSGCTEEELVAEIVLDANRLSTFGHPEAYAELRKVLETHTWDEAVKEAAKFVSCY